MKIYKSQVGEIVPIYRTNDQVKKVQITCSNDSVKFIRNIWSEQLNYIEDMILLPLNRNNNTIGWIKLSSGGTAGTICDVKVIFQILLNCNASAFILFHNHPSGNLQPSKADIEITKKIKKASELLDIKMLDNVIITEEKYYSFADESIL